MSRAPSINDLPKTTEEAQEAILNLSTSAERRLIALGSHYTALNLTEDTLKEVEDDLRRARLYEVYVLSSIQRRCELDAQRRRLAELEIGSSQQNQERAIAIQRLKRQALIALQQEAEYERESTTLVNDRRAILEREKNALLERRKAFDRGELVPKGTEGNSSLGYRPKEGAPPVVVMNVAIGNGRQEQLVVRDGDDPRRIAVAFVRKYQLPDHVVQTLQAQIVQNISNYEKKRASTPGNRFTGGASSAAARAMSTATAMTGGNNRAYSPAASTTRGGGASTPRGGANPLMRV
jgi:hypothetical protein